MGGRAVILQGDARHLPLPDASVDLIVTSPPYWLLREYREGGERLEGQIGLETTWQEYIANLLDCTREWVRVLKPEGNLFVNLGDKYGRGTRTTIHGGHSKQAYVDGDRPGVCAPSGYEKSLLNLPARYAIACTDQLGLIQRADIIWSKINGLPESARDRVRRSHEVMYHFVKQERYYSALDEIRIPQSEGSHLVKNPSAKNVSGNGLRHRMFANYTASYDPRGKVPGSVWEILSEALHIPDYLRSASGEELDHYAAFPTALIRPVVVGFSPREVCTACQQGRFPVSVHRRVPDRPGRVQGRDGDSLEDTHGQDGRAGSRWNAAVEVVGYACACTPYTDHPERRSKGWHEHGEDTSEQGPVREYHWDSWEPAATSPGVVLDPFGGAGTTALVSVVHGRTGISNDLGSDYARITQWRVRDGAERARALGLKKTPKEKRSHEHLYGDLFDELDALTEP